MVHSTHPHIHTQSNHGTHARTHPQVALLDLQPVIALPLQLPSLPLLGHAHLQFFWGGGGIDKMAQCVCANAIPRTPLSKCKHSHPSD